MAERKQSCSQAVYVQSCWILEDKHSICIPCAIYGDLWCRYRFWLSFLVSMNYFATWGRVATWTEMTLEACVWGLSDNSTLRCYVIMCWCLVARVFKMFLKILYVLYHPFEKMMFSSNLMVDRWTRSPKHCQFWVAFKIVVLGSEFKVWKHCFSLHILHGFLCGRWRQH